MKRGEKIDQYEILGLLGKGAMGEVYRVSDTRMFGRIAALKILSHRTGESRMAATRFDREVQELARLQHPNIITVYDSGEHDGRRYFVMEFVEGADLAQVIREPGSRTVEERLEIARQVCEGLQFAHDHGTVHRDIKPANIMLLRQGGRDVPKLVDFGIAHVERSDLTRSESQPGTYAYMSPEQLRNEAIDHRSDLFSLGIVLYELFSGAHPFEGASEILISGNILHEEPRGMREIDPDVAPALDALVLRLLEKEPTNRPSSAADVADEIERVKRKVLTKGSGTDPADYENLDDLTRQMVRDLTDWARQKESEGSYQEAVNAYEKAARLVPDSPRLRRKARSSRYRLESVKKIGELLARARQALESGDREAAREHWRTAWVVNPDDREVRELETALEAADAKAGEDGGAAGFVEARIRASEDELRAGRLEEAREILVEVLQKHPGDSRAARLLDRLLSIEEQEVPYAAYREAVVEAEEELRSGRREEASRACARALDLWPDGEEALALRGRIESLPAETVPVRPRPSRASESETVPVRPTPSRPRRPRHRQDPVPPERAKRRRRQPAARRPPGRQAWAGRTLAIVLTTGILLVIAAFVVIRVWTGTEEQPAPEVAVLDSPGTGPAGDRAVSSDTPEPAAAGEPGSDPALEGMPEESITAEQPAEASVPAPAPATPSPETEAIPLDETLLVTGRVREAIDRWIGAQESLDALEVKRQDPSVPDVDVLQRMFDGIDRQRIALMDEAISFDESSRSAEVRGRLRYRILPKGQTEEAVDEVGVYYRLSRVGESWKVMETAFFRSPEETAVREALQEWIWAHEQLDPLAVQRIHPAHPDIEGLRTAMSRLDGQEIEISHLMTDFDPSGDGATVRCRVRFDTREAASGRTERETKIGRFRLEKASWGWTIVSVDLH